MSYIDGKNVPGSHSPFTVWIRHSGGYVVGVSFHLLNDYIQKYNKKGYSKYFEFWPWFSYNEFGDADAIEGYSALWNEHNANMNKLLTIK